MKCGEYGWYSAGPIQRSQSSPSGTLSRRARSGIRAWESSRRIVVQVCTSRISPRSPLRTHEVKVRWLANEWPWLPIWVTTSYVRAASTSWRTSHTVRASGFSV